MEKVLLHCCCGPCSTASIETLKNLGYAVVLFFGNSNIYPQSEHAKRLENLKKVATYFDLEVITGEYNHGAWLQQITGYENEREGGKRCNLCFEFNLKEAAYVAANHDIAYFTTTLTVSPHKSSPLIFKIGEKWSQFLAVDFKKKGGFHRSIELSKILELYRQDYCGCEFSKRERAKRVP
ncbi:MAG: epoxyqueuosine reductase QueH [Sphaerochaetaceae bacterium]